jgi:sortase A
VNTVRLATRTLGELLITLGAILLLLVVYQLVWTNVQANAQAAQMTDQIEQRWRSDLPDVVPAAGATTKPTTVDQGVGFARLYIPRLGDGWVKPVLQGVSLPDLAKGVGHYPKTQLPGQVGNVAVAGHRATNGEPFRNLNQLRRGDLVVMETKSSWFTYTVRRSEIVAPGQVDVLLPVPRHRGVRPTERLLTLTTCNPRWASYQRLMYSVLTDQRPKSAGRPPALSAPAGGG